jgi:hypothetical protein
LVAVILSIYDERECACLEVNTSTNCLTSLYAISTLTEWLKALNYISRLSEKLAIVLAATDTNLVRTDKINPAYNLSRDQCLHRKVQDS